MDSAPTGMTMAQTRAYFDETPYFVQSYAQFFQTTKGNPCTKLRLTYLLLGKRLPRTGALYLLRGP